MANRIVRSSFAGRRSKRATDWAIGANSTGGITVPAASKVLLIGFSAATLAPQAPATIVRTRGVLTIFSDQGAAAENQIGAFGIALVNDTARALGPTAIPGPSSVSLWDGWFVFQEFHQNFTFGSAVGTQQGGAGMSYVLDSKAMRKFEGDQGLVVMIENGHATHGLAVMFGFRMLVKAG